MSTSDGTILGTTQIFGDAPRNRAFTIVMLADGFTNVQQNNFNNACTVFVNALIATPPFDELKTAINIFRVNVRSTDSGADDPIAGGGTGATARTYFDASFGGGNIRRLLLCNNATALQVAASRVPEFEYRTRCCKLNNLWRLWWLCRYLFFSCECCRNCTSQRWDTLHLVLQMNMNITQVAMRSGMITTRRANRRNPMLQQTPIVTL